MKRAFWMAGLVACGTMSQLSAQDISPADLFNQLDKNKDQVLTLDEIPEGQTRFFERVLRVGDVDADGKVTLKEFQSTFKEQSTPSPEAKDGLKREAIRPDADVMQQRPDPAQLFQRLDRNGDGMLNRDELPAELAPRLQALFDRLGTDSISLEQFSRMSGQPGGDRPSMGSSGGAPGMRERMRGPEGMPQDGMRQPGNGPFGHMALIRALDLDGNGRISQQEMEKATIIFAQLDTNGDGELDVQEIMGFQRGGPGGEGGFRGFGRDGAGPGGRPDGAIGTRGPGRPDGERRFPSGNGGPIDASSLFQRLDVNGDGILTPEELPERMRERVQMIDQNQDGMISQDELAAMLRNMRGPGGDPEGGRPSGGPRPVEGPSASK